MNPISKAKSIIGISWADVCIFALYVTPVTAHTPARAGNSDMQAAKHQGISSLI